MNQMHAIERGAVSIRCRRVKSVENIEDQGVPTSPVVRDGVKHLLAFAGGQLDV
jgi:hypothetical protein